MRYDVVLETGELLVRNVEEPVYGACRLLVGRGLQGRLEVWRPEKAHPDMVLRDPFQAARGTIEEAAKIGRRLTKHRPMTAEALTPACRGRVIRRGHYSTEGNTGRFGTK